MQTGLPSRARRLTPAIFPLLLLAAGCSGDREAMEKRLSGLQEEVTRLQNTNDRLAERLQALEIQSAFAKRQAQAEGRPLEPEDTRVVRPQLKVVKVAPGDSHEPPAAAEEPQQSPEEEREPRPVLRDHGKPPTPAWAKPRAKAGSIGQNPSGARARTNPQGT